MTVHVDRRPRAGTSRRTCASRCPSAEEAKLNLPGLALASAIRLGDVLGLHRRMHEQHQRQLRDQSERREVLARIEAGVDVERRVDADAAGVAEHQRVAVGRRLDHRARADDAGAGAAVLDHHGLAEAGAQPVGHDARHGVVAAAGRERHHQRDGLGRIVLAPAPGRPAPSSAAAIAPIASASDVSWIAPCVCSNALMRRRSSIVLADAADASSSQRRTRCSGPCRTIGKSAL